MNDLTAHIGTEITFDRSPNVARVWATDITQEMLDDLMIEFVTTVSSNGSLSGNTDSTERLLLSFLPQDKVDAIMEDNGNGGA